jgi:glucose-1-phosphate adenylyltransferase
MQTLVSIRGMIDRIEEEHVLCCDCDAVGRADFAPFIAAHKESGLSMTVGSAQESSVADFGALHIWIAQTAFLRDLLYRAEERFPTSFYRDVVRRESAKGNVGVYRFPERFFKLNSLAEYYRLHMLLAGDCGVHRSLLEDENFPLLTKAQNLPPVKYGKNATVECSLIADGCLIEGTVKNSVLFRGVHVGADCVVENAVISERCVLSGHAQLSGAILDKNVILGGNVRLAGHPSLPFFVEEGRVIN